MFLWVRVFVCGSSDTRILMSFWGMTARPSTAYRSDFTDPGVHRLSVSGLLGFAGVWGLESDGLRRSLEIWGSPCLVSTANGSHWDVEFNGSLTCIGFDLAVVVSCPCARMTKSWRPAMGEAM